MFKENKLSGYAFICIALFLFIAPIFTGVHHAISWDVWGYYLYLPSFFIQEEWWEVGAKSMQKWIEQYHFCNAYYQANPLPNGGWVLKYTMGNALLQSPFFFLAHFIARIFGLQADGYSPIYQWFQVYGSVFYGLIGVAAMRKNLLCFVEDRWASATLLLFFFGTNLFFFRIDPMWYLIPHWYVFVLINVLLYLILNWPGKREPFYTACIGIISGLILLCRPSDGVVLILPLLFLWFKRKTFTSSFILLLLFYVLALVITVSPQFIYWKKVTGNWWYLGYQNAGEGFDFIRPHILLSLFSFRKGLLVYTPLLVFSLPGFYFLYTKNKSWFWMALVFFVVNLYVVSSWSVWWYAESFANRGYTESYSVLALLLALFLNGIKSGLLRKTSGIIMLLFAGLNLFQTWQYEKGIIHPSRQTKEYYLSSFFDLKFHPEKEKLLLVDRSEEASRICSKCKERTRYNISPALNVIGFIGEKPPIEMSGGNAYLGVYRTTCNELANGSAHVWMRFNLTGKIVSKPENVLLSQVMEISYRGRQYSYTCKDFKTVADSNGNVKSELDFLLPEFRSGQDSVKFYLWHRKPGCIKVTSWEMVKFLPKDK